VLRVTVRRNQFRSVGRALPGQVDALLSRVAYGIEADWKEDVRVDTGNLRRSRSPVAMRSRRQRTMHRLRSSARAICAARTRRLRRPARGARRWSVGRKG
jgi:hypothetical protein